MPWTPQGGGGGPWGSGGGNSGGGGPWGRPGGGGGGGGGGGPQPPDIEELIRKSQDRFKRLMPGGFGGGRALALVALIGLALWGATGFYRVNPSEQGVVLRFGKWVDTTGPGLHYHLPSPIETVIKPNVTQTNLVQIGYRAQGGEIPRPGMRAAGVRDVPEESIMLTGDENIVDIDFSVFWVINDAGQYLFNIRDPDGTVRAAAESVMRDIIGQTPIQSALTAGRAEIEIATRDRLQALLDEYGAGVTITQVQLLSVDPPAPVVDAFNDVQRARADQERLRNEAEAYRNDIIPRARGEAERIVQEAEAYREQIVNAAEGDAQRFLSVYQAYVGAEDVTARRLYLETMEEVMRGTSKIIIDPAAENGGRGVVPYLPLPELRPRQGQPPAPGQQAQGQQQPSPTAALAPGGAR
ncbi:FtsH protease activity modulator HflK [Telmatospirillum sp. J64-1]|uniref:FtsH protease activity modulator HflK n=1 Tax=Telmatospirillum sp. J64-1 TaxID=2502183 RepID=UPI00115EAF0F|nr:FtsH protease activity modulator HflK [Telmatospirillum sp. J64-1]